MGTRLSNGKSIVYNNIILSVDIDEDICRLFNGRFMR